MLRSGYIWNITYEFSILKHSSCKFKSNKYLKKIFQFQPLKLQYILIFYWTLKKMKQFTF